MNDVTIKTAALENVYRLHDRISGVYELACSEGCSVCCTRNVCVTSLETYYLLDGLEPETLETVAARVKDSFGLNRQIPKVTINDMADLCMKGEPLPEEDSDPEWGACPLLENNRCMVYPVRPFACRSMVSSEHCGIEGLADMDEFLVTAANVFMQYLEHTDLGNVTANMSDMILAFSEKGVMEHYRNTGKLEVEKPGFLKNKPVSILMIPPEHREKMGPILTEL